MSAGSTQAQKLGTGAEFRRHQRERFVSTVHLLLPGRRIVEARTLDISVGGLLVVSPLSVPDHAVCGVRLLVPAIPEGTFQVLARAQVVSNRFSGKENGFLMGLRFTALPRASLAAIREYLADKTTNAARPNRLRGYSPGADESEDAPPPLS
ncbi:PilZ domain-containing protein [Azohydromonas caseinilytica]|uniref:PilZ domain-containing protein n=1 Tax=Azohydromonas caseinilytica TaxID=2728836 RepID=A0A848F610_9BURK|nr:PilZ domain-containing protein [Azohydromonas caseinilytica]NML14019.1 PilZ domain-containing protein [Azohydromonas caseinilytica]